MKEFLKYVLATVTGIILVTIVMAILGVISLVGLAASSASTTQVEENSVFTLMLSGQLEERTQSNPFAKYMGQAAENLGLDEIIDAIHKAKNNDDIKGIYIEAGVFSADTPASTHAIREALLDFQKSGKWIVAYADSYTQSTYYICSVADKLYLNPQGMVDWHGLASTPYFVKDLLAKFGVKYQLCKVGKYKSAPEMMTADKMSEPNREQVTAYINGIWQVMLSDVSKSRKVSVDSLNAYADRYVALSDQKDLIRMKLVDKLLYTNEVKDEIKKRLKIGKNDHINQLTLEEMGAVPGKKEEGEKIAVYYAFGDIVDSETGNTLSQGHSIVATEVCKDLEDLMNNDDVKAVVLRVNSPGGSAYASEQIWNAVKNLRAKKPVVVSMGGYAASGGYYISCGANYIYSEPTTITGSIGIFGMFPDFSGLLTDKLGVKFDEVKTNKFAAFGTMARPFNADELALLDQYIGRGYELFRQRVADGRKLPVAQVEEIAQGRVWLGNDALKIKLVDAIGSLDDAIKKAAQLAKVDKYYVNNYPDEPSWLESLTSTLDSSSYLDEQVHETLGEFYAPFTYLKNINKQNAIQARLPYFVTIQ
ncbi:MAG: signal peptide peptidase SppA [Prevotella sp.]|nr:signal peptide peptidase SppA [Prevotella sp.]